MNIPLYAYRTGSRAGVPHREKIQIGTAEVNIETGEVKCIIEDAQMMNDLSISVQEHSIGWIRTPNVHDYNRSNYRGGTRLNDLLVPGQRLMRADIIFKYPVPIIEEGPND